MKNRKNIVISIDLENKNLKELKKLKEEKFFEISNVKIFKNKFEKRIIYNNLLNIYLKNVLG
jgi:hypothetical protein